MCQRLREQHENINQLVCYSLSNIKYRKLHKLFRTRLFVFIFRLSARFPHRKWKYFPLSELLVRTSCFGQFVPVSADFAKFELSSLDFKLFLPIRTAFVQHPKPRGQLSPQARKR